MAQMSQECVSEIHKQTNNRIYDRNLPSQPLQQYIDVRPVMTKYSYFPNCRPKKKHKRTPNTTTNI